MCVSILYDYGIVLHLYKLIFCVCGSLCVLCLLGGKGMEKDDVARLINMAVKDVMVRLDIPQDVYGHMLMSLCMGIHYLDHDTDIGTR